MVCLNQSFFYSFLSDDGPVSVHYSFQSEGSAIQERKTVLLWLVIKTQDFAIKLLKPDMILSQPIEIIEKIVQREVLRYMAGELL